jgi:hypothetical protein
MTCVVHVGSRYHISGTGLPSRISQDKPGKVAACGQLSRRLFTRIISNHRRNAMARQITNDVLDARLKCRF